MAPGGLDHSSRRAFSCALASRFHAFLFVIGFVIDAAGLLN
jgi:hypothetical protein